MLNNHYVENKNRFKCDMAHYLRAGIGRCIWIIEADNVLFTFSLIFMFFSLLWIHTMIVYNGIADLNRYGEGYPEAIMFAIIGLIGLRATTKPKKERGSYDPLV